MYVRLTRLIWDLKNQMPFSIQIVAWTEQIFTQYNECTPLMTILLNTHPILQIVDRAIEVVEKRSPSINPKQAAKGRVDYVKVQDWGSGNQEDLGELKVESSTRSVDPSSVPFHEQLARHLDALQAQGSLAVAQPEGSKPLPPFEKWAFARIHYIQYLADLLKAHQALEESLDRCIASLQDAGLVEYIEGFQPLYRSKCIDSDASLVSEGSAVPESSPNASSYAQYIMSLAGKIGAAESDEEAKKLCLRIVSHAYIIYLSLLSSGTRIGAAAAERLNLFPINALQTYRSYPEQVNQPLETLISLVNRLGRSLKDAEKEIVMEEVATAMQRSALLLEALAKEWIVCLEGSINQSFFLTIVKFGNSI